MDRTGKLFWWNDEVYRAISSDRAEFYRELLDKRNLEHLFEKGLIAAEIAPFEVENYGLVLKHYRVPTISYCMEWSSAMLKDAALLICDLSIELYADGLTLKDAHPWNVLFDDGRPIFVDWGSIECMNGRRKWPYDAFNAWFILPLYLMSAGRSNLARKLMADVMNRPRRGDVARLMIGRVGLWTWLHHWLGEIVRLRSYAQPNQDFFLTLRKTIEDIPVSGETTEWTKYQGPDTKFSLDSDQEWPVRIKNVGRLIEVFKPKTLLDIGCNRGWFSELAERRGAHVTSIDIDEPSINTLYGNVKSKQLHVLPLVMDICSP
ncbi:MAG: class I SAM-dependent methyltransferase, partial [Anaerolineaceae bacterium]